ncbi:carboxymuconolactone decarboxylase family protein [Limosilactobacillus sp. STM2_1]|uniref:Carboxymuconolactone decarboxylase family protein n=1 Tax=Limosilactobacillus rudii TaxID=2759755 RepID=A0A7W3UMW0_9LACO|nr:carboxymuconolactone decarboxylase family protein [Limosilactobacillus rudii]MBB1079303.1 carboxymuconolactone decarboxylase family protein [Limosilactobacillus rudii]MBB1098503.1 carboxymuconolactone decarboxylase family protein [Limosilactobacillus rudii]MCD7135511.1 carboxymuconolactone decarboxylase family protein [Limosilactobacillus rudii]
MTDYQQELTEIMDNNKNIFSSTGEVGKNFLNVHDAAIKDGALDSKTKALEALGIAIAIRCEGCIIQHVKGAIKLGATRDEIIETINVAIMMGGGPSTVYGGKALACADQFLNK